MYVKFGSLTICKSYANNFFPIFKIDLLSLPGFSDLTI